MTCATLASRLHSTAGVDDDPAARFDALVVDRASSTVTTWSSVLHIGKSGLPSQVTSRRGGKPLLAAFFGSQFH